MKIEESAVLISIGIVFFAVGGVFMPHSTTIIESAGVLFLTISGLLIGCGVGLSYKEETK